MKSHYIEIIKDIDRDLTIKGYENELVRAFINIINNAKDALVRNVTYEYMQRCKFLHHSLRN